MIILSRNPLPSVLLAGDTSCCPVVGEGEAFVGLPSEPSLLLSPTFSLSLITISGRDFVGEKGTLVEAIFAATVEFDLCEWANGGGGRGGGTFLLGELEGVSVVAMGEGFFVGLAEGDLVSEG